MIISISIYIFSKLFSVVSCSSSSQFSSFLPYVFFFLSLLFYLWCIGLFSLDVCYFDLILLLLHCAFLCFSVSYPLYVSSLLLSSLQIFRDLLVLFLRLILLILLLFLAIFWVLCSFSLYSLAFLRRPKSPSVA